VLHSGQSIARRCCERHHRFPPARVGGKMPRRRRPLTPGLGRQSPAVRVRAPIRCRIPESRKRARVAPRAKPSLRARPHPEPGRRESFTLRVCQCRAGTGRAGGVQPGQCRMVKHVLEGRRRSCHAGRYRPGAPLRTVMQRDVAGVVHVIPHGDRSGCSRGEAEITLRLSRLTAALRPNGDCGARAPGPAPRRLRGS